MATLRRLSHIGFNVPRELFDKECEFWEKVMGLTYVHGDPGRNAFFTADLLRDHEFILYAVDGPVAAYGQPGGTSTTWLSTSPPMLTSASSPPGCALTATTSTSLPTVGAARTK